MSRILVTGGKGFLGSHLCRELAAHGHDPRPVDWDEGDLRQPVTIEKHLRVHEPDVVVHLAARVGRLRGEWLPMDTVVDNAGMTALIARACGERGVKLVYASTSEVYGDQGERVCFEDEQELASAAVEGATLSIRRLPHNLYGLSKRWGEEACRLYAPAGLVVLRFSMPYGPGHPAGTGRAAITNFLLQAYLRQRIPVHRGGERSWCWVGDTARAVRMILESGQSGAFNVGRDDDPRPMVDVARLACDLAGAPHDLIDELDPPPAQTIVKRLSTRRLRRLGWEPVVPLAEGMRRTLDWLEAERQAAAL